MKDKSLLERLEEARTKIEKAYEEDNAELMGKYAKNFQSLHSECLNLEEDTKEYHYAEYLRLLIQFYFEFMFDGGGSSEDTYNSCQAEAFHAGLKSIE